MVIHKRTRQEYSMSPLLFNIYSELMEEAFNREGIGSL